MQQPPNDRLLRERSDYQRQYYRGGESRHRRIEPVDTPYVRRHFARACRHLGLVPGLHVLEVGAGLGRFTGMLLEEDVDVTACDVSSELTSELRSTLKSPRLDVIECDLCDLPRLERRTETDSPSNRLFDCVVGFFVLHHLPDLDAAFSALARVIAPGGRVVFCEPNGRNPAYYAQILFSRSMTWRGDGGLRGMVPARVLPAMARHGFRELEVDRYGLLPPELANTAVGQRLEAWGDRHGPPWGLHAFHIFRGILGRSVEGDVSKGAGTG